MKRQRNNSLTKLLSFLDLLLDLSMQKRVRGNVDCEPIGVFVNKFTAIVSPIILAGFVFLNFAFAAQFDITGPAGSRAFGEDVKILPNGNFVVVDSAYDVLSPQFIGSAGAVFLYDPSGVLISTITGRCTGDTIGSGGITILANGNFVISSPNVGEPQCSFPYPVDVGAVTWASADSGVSGLISETNSLIGSFAYDRIGDVTPLTDGNYLVRCGFWNSNKGAVKWQSGTTSSGGTISEANSLVGTSNFDGIGQVTILTNGNYVVFSPTWNANRGAVTLCLLSNPCTGPVSSSNSLVGSLAGDDVSNQGVTALSNGNYVVVSRNWNGQRGAVTLGSGMTGIVGAVSAANSLVGSLVNDRVGNGGVTPLVNGNYVVRSDSWDGPVNSDVGAATFGSGTFGVVGPVSSANSLIGNRGSDFYMSRIVGLANSNYVILLPKVFIPATSSIGAAIWGDGAIGVQGNFSTSTTISLYPGAFDVAALSNGNYVVASLTSVSGAATFCNGSTGTSGVVSSVNSLVGSVQGDAIGSGGITALKNGNYVVNSPQWRNGSIQWAGAVTFCNGTTGMIGVVSPSNSLVGTHSFDQIGFGGSTALSNGNYVVRSELWDNGANTNAGAVTFGNGVSGISGEVSPSNSLVGEETDSNVGKNGITPLSNGNYVVTSFAWLNRGAVTWGSGVTGVAGPVSALNSIIGSTSDDRVGTRGNNNAVRTFSDGTYFAHSANWDNQGIQDAGAITLGKANSPTVGIITDENSVRGTVALQGFNLVGDYSPSRKFFVVGRENSRIVTVFSYPVVRATVFDLDGDGKTDISVFRPNGVSGAEWWWLKSTGGNGAVQFGGATDNIAASDFTSDGKTDVAFFRPSTGQWFVLRSENLTFYAFPFGSNGDIPVPADYDGDGKADAAVYRPGALTWYISKSTGGTDIVGFGASGDKPVVADYDGDGKADIAVFRPSGANGAEWWIRRSSNASVFATQFGSSTDKAVPADYTGDGKADIAFWTPSSGNWFVLRSEDFSYFAFPFGSSADIPSPGDYDGDGKTDAVVFRPSNSTWYAQRSTAGLLIQQFGASGDVPVPSSYVR